MDRPSNDPFRDRAATGRDDRQPPRDSLFLTATLRIAGDEAQVRVRNLSAGGLMAEYARPVSLGEPLTIEVRGVGWVEGRIAWATDGRIGIAFSQPIDPKLARKPVGKGGRGDDDRGWLHVYPAAAPPRLRR